MASSRGADQGSVGVDSLQRLDVLCDEFESVWRSGGRPRIEDFVARAVESDREPLFRELLALEIEYRQEKGEVSRVDEYLVRFPAWSEIVETALGKPRSAGDEETAVQGQGPATPFFLGSRSDGPIPNVDGYEVEGVLGRGGMGVVYRARQKGLNRQVALKMISAAAGGGNEVSRFLVEAETVARLQHPHIVQIFEVGQADGLPYFSLELMSGGNLREMCQGNPLDSDKAAALMETLARAVHYLHDNGIVHRDLKPANVLMAGDSTPKISDFGLAKLMREGSGQTQTGDVLGTPSYMAPEQAAGRVGDVGPSADIYALGAILYELLAGKAPFRGATPVETVRMVIDEEPAPPSRLRPGLPRDLEIICLKCLEKDPARRYATALALAEDLQRYLRHEPIQARPVGAVERCWKWARRRPAMAALVGVSVFAALALAGSGWAFNAKLSSLFHQVEEESEGRRKSLVRLQVETGHRRAEAGDFLGAMPWYAEALRLDRDYPEEARLHRVRMAALLRKSPRLAQVWAHNGPVRHAAFSSDGSRLATSCGDGAARVWDVATGQLIGSPLRHQGYVSFVDLSSNGSRLATASYDKTARVWDVDSGKPLTDSLPVGHDVHVVTFSPDGERLLTASDGGAQLWNARTSQPAEPPFQVSGVIRHAAFNADGTQVLLTDGQDFGWVYELATGKRLPNRTTLPAGFRQGTVIRYGAFSPDGSRALLSAKQNVELWDTKSWTKIDGKTSGETIVNWPTQHAAFSPDGKLIVSGGADGAVRLWGSSVGLQRAWWTPMWHGAAIHYVAFSPDSRQVVSIGADFSAIVWHVPTGERLTPALTHGGVIHHAAFSPDGRYLVTTGEEGLVRLWDLTSVWPTDRILTEESWPMPEYSDDGRWAVSMVVKPGGQGRTVKIWNTATGDEVAQLPEEKAFKWTFSPDGRYLVGSNLWQVPKGRRVGSFQMNDVAMQQGFSPDSSLTFALINQFDYSGPKVKSSAAINVWKTDTGELALPPIASEKLFTRTANSTAGLAAISPNGRWLAAGGRDHLAHVWDLKDGKLAVPPLVHEEKIVYVHFSPDSRRLVTAGHDRTARIWDVETGHAATPPLEHADDLYFAKFSPDGRRVVTGSYDRTARLWDAATGTPVTQPMVHAADVDNAHFSPDGTLLVTFAGKWIRVWDTATGSPLTPPWASVYGKIADARFADDSRTLQLRLAEGGVVSWDLTPEASTEAALRDWALILSGRKIDDTGAASPAPPAAIVEAWNRQRSATLESSTPIAWHRNEAMFGNSIWHLDRLIALAPSPNGYLRRAELWARTGEWEKSWSDYTAAAEQNPDPHRRQRIWNFAHAGLSLGVYLRPKDWHGYQTRGQAQLRLERWDAALADFAKAHDLNSQSPQPWLGRRDAFVGKGDQPAAENAAAEAKKLQGK